MTSLSDWQAVWNGETQAVIAAIVLLFTAIAIIVLVYETIDNPRVSPWLHWFLIVSLCIFFVFFSALYRQGH